MNTNAVSFFENEELLSPGANCSLLLAVYKIKNPGNVGNIIRLAHNINASKIYFIDDEPQIKEAKIRKTAGFSFDQMEWSFISESDFSELQLPGVGLVALETSTGAKNIFKTQLPEKILVLAGSENYGLPQEWVEKCTDRIFIPMPGACKSMNISHALAVSAFEWYRQHAK